MRDSAAVARALEKVHAEESSPLFYNNEQTLRATVKLAYFACRDKYIKMEELAGGKGYADVLKGCDVPVLLVGISYDKKTKKHSCLIELLESVG